MKTLQTKYYENDICLVYFSHSVICIKSYKEQSSYDLFLRRMQFVGFHLLITKLETLSRATYVQAISLALL